MSNRTKGLLILAVIFFIGGLSAAQLSTTSPSALTGAVTSAGKPVEGVAVSARADGKTFTTSVFTDSNGVYAFPGLEDGRHAIWAQAVGFEAMKAEQVVSGGKKAQQNFALKTLQDFSKQLSGDEFVASLPGDSPQDLRMKAIFTNNCTGCHQASFLLQNRFDARGWAAIVNFMARTDPFASVRDPEGPGSPMIQAYKEELVGYLTQVRGPNSAPLKIKLVPRPTGDAARVVITEFDVPPGQQPDYIQKHNGSIWSDGTPSSHAAHAPHDAVVDRQGIVWFTDQINPERTLGRLDPKTGKTTGYKLAGSEGISCHSHGLVLDASGNIFLNCQDNGTFAKFDPRTEQFTKFPRPDTLPDVGGTLVVDSKGFIWAQTNEGAIKLDAKTGNYTGYKQPTPGGTYGITVDKEDKVWFTQPGLNQVVVVDTAGKMSEVRMPPLPGDLSNDKDRQLASTLRSGANSGTPSIKVPRRLAADPNGDYVWVAEYSVDLLARIDIHTKEVKEYPMPHRYSQPYSVVVDKDHMVWIALMNTDRIAKFNPFTEQFTEYTLPTRGTEARFIAVDNSTDPPSVWLPYFRTNKLARIQPLSTTNKIAKTER